jgi:hypothetical protein
VGRIVLSRPAIEAGESIGFLPGDMEDKLAPYLRPLYDALTDRMSMKRVRALIAEGAIEIAPVGYMRGRTLNNAFVVIDEAQNCTYVQLKMLLTRLGWNSTMVVTGDPAQSDLLPGISGLADVADKARGGGQHRHRPPGRPRHRPPPAGGRDAGRSLTLRGILLGVLITLVFTAAQVYLGLKVGLTFATSIPAAVISMALLSAFKDATIQENNIVQTIASAAGTLASVIFVLPGLLMIGWWAHVPFWPTFGACAIGGVLGVMYTVPLRRALVIAVRPALSGRRGRCRSAEGRHGLARRARPKARPACVAVIWGSAGVGRLRRAAAAKIWPAKWRSTSRRRRRDRHRRFQFAGADRRRPPDGHHGRHRDAGRPGDRLGRAGAADDDP